MFALLGFFLGLIIVAICIPLKIFQLGLSLKNTKTKLDVKKEKAKNSLIKGKLSQLGKRKKSDSADEENKPLLTGNKDIQKLKASRGNKKEQEKVIKKINLKTKMTDIIISQLRLLLSIWLPTGQFLIVTCLFGALIFLVVLAALIAACSFVVLLFNGSNDSGGLGGLGGSFLTGGNGSNGGISSDVGVKTGTKTEDAVRDMATWYIEHVDTYQNHFHNNGICCGTKGHEYYQSVKDDETKYRVQNGCGFYYCDLINDWVRDDCTGFAAAVASLASGEKVAISYSGAMIGSWDAENHGYRRLSYTELTDISNLQAGAIIVTQGHAEVVIDEQSTFGWGAIQSSYPSHRAVLLKSDGIKMSDDQRPYTTIYMYER